MRNPNGMYPDEIVEPGGELSEGDLEFVVGGLARPWTESDVADGGDVSDDRLVTPAISLV